MQTKKKLCDGPCAEEKFIWKNHEGKRYCISCWNRLFGVVKLKKATKPIDPVSHKRTLLNVMYMKARNRFLTINPNCAARLLGCIGVATEVHHKAGRTGDLLVSQDNFLPVCRNCHQFIELNPKIAKELGFSTNRL